jgi:hypothetical protein
MVGINCPKIIKSKEWNNTLSKINVFYMFFFQLSKMLANSCFYKMRTCQPIGSENSHFWEI